MLPKEKTIFDELAELEWATSQEIKTEDDAYRIINAGKYEKQLNDLIQEALLYIGMHEIRNSSVSDLTYLVDIRKRDAELHKLKSEKKLSWHYNYSLEEIKKIVHRWEQAKARGAKMGKWAKSEGFCERTLRNYVNLVKNSAM
jgi:hypothetical protein